MKRDNLVILSSVLITGGLLLSCHILWLGLIIIIIGVNVGITSFKVGEDKDEH